MVLLIDASRANRPHKTGVEWYSFHMITELIAQLPAEDRAILLFDVPPGPEWPPLLTNVEIKLLAWPPKFFWTLIRLSMTLIRYRDSDAIFISLAGALPLIHPKKILTVIHDVGFLVEPRWYSRCDRWYQIISTGHAMRCATAIVTPSQFSKSEIERFYPSRPSYITVIPNAPAITPQVRRDSQNYFLYVGRIEHKKNILTLIAAFELYAQDHRETTLHLVGGKGVGFDEIAEKIHESAIADRIHLIGHLGADALSREYAGARAFIFPSHYEGFGIPLLEAMAAGVPVIASDIPAHREVCGPHARYFTVDNPESLVQVLKQIDTDDGTIQEIVQGDAKNHANSYSWKSSAGQLYQMLKQLDNEQTNS